MEKIQCKICNRKFDSEESLAQHVKAKHEVLPKERNEISKKKMKKYAAIAVLLVALMLFSYTFYVRAQKPGQYDDFAKCLTEKGAVVYGNDFCQYTGKQLNFFGKSKSYLKYVKCSENEGLCNQKGVKVTPTWEINGKMYTQVQTFEKLSQLTGCSL